MCGFYVSISIFHSLNCNTCNTVIWILISNVRIKGFVRNVELLRFLLFLDSYGLKNFKVSKCGFAKDKVHTMFYGFRLVFYETFAIFAKWHFFVWTESANIFNWNLSIHFNQMTINWRLFCLLQFLCFVNQLLNSTRLIVQLGTYTKLQVEKLNQFMSKNYN